MPGHATTPALEHRVGQRIGTSARLQAGEAGPVGLLKVSGNDSSPQIISGSIHAQFERGQMPLGQLHPNIIARLEFGVDGASHEIFFSVARGTMFTVAASGLTLSVARVLEPAPEDNGACLITAGLVYGTHPTATYPPQLEQAVVFPGAPGPLPVAALVPIPPFARSFSLLAELPDEVYGPLHTLGITALDSSFTPVVLASYRPVYPLVAQPLPAGAAFLRLATLFTPAMSVRVLFELAL